MQICMFSNEMYNSTYLFSAQKIRKHFTIITMLCSVFEVSLLKSQLLSLLFYYSKKLLLNSGKDIAVVVEALTLVPMNDAFVVVIEHICRRGIYEKILSEFERSLREMEGREGRGF